MNAAYSSMGDGTWIYPNSTQIASLGLSQKTPSLLAAKNDTVAIKTEKKEEDKDEAKTEDKDGKEEKTVDAEVVDADFEEVKEDQDTQAEKKSDK